MTTHPMHHGHARADRSTGVPVGADRFLAPLGRLLFALIFIVSGPTHFSGEAIHMAAAHGVPLARIAVPAAGVIALLGGLSILFGLRARFGALLLLVFLIPVTLAMHDFWNAVDPMTVQIQRVMFMKNLALMGGALLIAYFGSGPFSVDGRRTRGTRYEPGPSMRNP